MSANQPARVAPRPYDGGAALGLPAYKPMEVGALASPGPTIPQNPRPAAPTRPSFADQMNGFQSQLDAQTASGPAPTPRPSFADQMNEFQKQLDVQTASGPGDPGPRLPSPEEVLDKQIRNAGEGNRGTVRLLTDEQKAKGLADTRAMNLRDGNILRSVAANGTVEYTDGGRPLRDGARIVDAKTGDFMPQRGQVITANGPVTLSEYGYVINHTDHIDRVNKAVASGDISKLSPNEQRMAQKIAAGGRFDSVGNINSKETLDTLARRDAELQRQNQGGGGSQLRSPMSIQDGVKAQIAALKGVGAKISHRTLRDILKSETDRFNNESSGNVNMRNKDLEVSATRENNLRTEQGAATRAEAEAARARQTQENSDRDFGLRMTQEQRAVREAGDKRVNDFASRRFIGKDDKPDAKRVADFQRGATASLPALIEQLKKNGQADYAARVEKEGFGALSDSDLEQMAQFNDIKQRLRASTGLGKDSKFVDSNNLLDYAPIGLSKDKTRVKLRNGSSLAVEDLAYDEPANAWLPDLFKGKSTAISGALPEDIRNNMKQ
jgi:hypothetical protein